MSEQHVVCQCEVIDNPNPPSPPPESPYDGLTLGQAIVTAGAAFVISSVLTAIFDSD